MARSAALAETQSGVAGAAFQQVRTPRRGDGGQVRRATAAVGYLRRSTDRQEQSIPDQKRAVEAYCAQHGLRLLRCYVDDAISGTSTIGRKGFQAMIADAQAPGGADFGAIVVYDVKRFGRIGNDGAWSPINGATGLSSRMRIRRS